MSTGTLERQEAEPNVDDIDPIPEIEAAIAADAALLEKADADGAADDGRSRDENGRYTGADKAKRAGQGEADEAPEDAEGSPAAKPTETKDGQQQQQKPDAKAELKPEAKDSGKPRSDWQRDNERKAKSWEGINQTKSELTREREQFDLERKQFEAQQAGARTGQRDEHGYTAAEYQRRSQQWTAQAQTLTQQAMQAEASNDFDAAERLQAQAQENARLGRLATQRAEALRGGGVNDVWKALGNDLPEAMQFDSEVNRQVRATLKGNAELLQSPLGPYRAAVIVGRQLLQAQGTELAKAKADALKVPGLEKQLAELTDQLQGLRQRTSLPGGGASLERGGGGERPFADLTLEEMERDLARFGGS